MDDIISGVGDATGSILTSLTAAGLLGTTQAQVAAQNLVAKQAGFSASGITLPGSVNTISWTSIIVVAALAFLLIRMVK